jgi:hypothetical protein
MKWYRGPGREKKRQWKRENSEKQREYQRLHNVRKKAANSSGS